MSVLAAALLAVAVNVRAPRSRLVTALAELHTVCRTDRTNQACTDFVERRLAASCIRERDAWRIDARAETRPVMYLFDLKAMLHERAHVGDIRDQLTGYVRSLSARRFDDERACLVSAAAASAGFEQEMNRMLRRSNERLH